MRTQKKKKSLIIKNAMNREKESTQLSGKRTNPRIFNRTNPRIHDKQSQRIF